MMPLRQLCPKSLVTRLASRRFGTTARSAVVGRLGALQPGGVFTQENNQYQQRALSTSYGGSQSRFPRTFPQYNIVGEDCMLAFKLMSPTFRSKGEILALDQSRRGRILLEFSPRRADGSFKWSEQIRFALSPEEVGLFCSQLPQVGIELSRAPSTYENPGSETGGITPTGPDTPDKVLKVEPGEASSVSFCIDHVKDGIGGQAPGPGQEGQAAGPLEVTAQAGEFEVILSIMKASIPHLLGWPTLMDISMRKGVDDAVHGVDRFDGTGGSGGSAPV